MARRTTLTALLLLLTAIASACGLLGVNNSAPDPAGVRATIDQLAAAAAGQDIERMKRHIAASLVAKLDSDPAPVGTGLEPQSAAGALDLLETVWSGVTMHDVKISASTIEIHGQTAIVHGSFVIAYTDASGVRKECVGTGSAELEATDGKWMVSMVEVDQVSCTVHTDPDPDPGSGGAPQFSFDACAYLVQGAQGEQVAALQTALKHLGFYTGRIDGDFGPMTASAVRAFQSDKGLYVDAEAGPMTLGTIDEVLRNDGGFFDCAVYDEKPSAGSTTLTYGSLRTGTPFETEVLTYTSPNPGPTIVLVGCIHGNERSGHLGLTQAIESGITISRGRLVIVPAFNRLACEQNRRTLSYSGDVLSGKDFNRMFPVGKRPSYYIAREMWDLIASLPDLAMVIDFHDGFINSLGNSLIHTQQSKAGAVARSLRDTLNAMRPSGATGPRWRAMTEPISGSLARKVGRDLGVPAILIELSGRSPGDPLSLRIKYVHEIIRHVGKLHDMQIMF